MLAVGAHLGYDYLIAEPVAGKDGGDVGDATVLLYLVVSLTVQRFALLRRVARDEAAAGPGPVGAPRGPLGA